MLVFLSSNDLWCLTILIRVTSIICCFLSRVCTPWNPKQTNRWFTARQQQHSAIISVSYNVRKIFESNAWQAWTADKNSCPSVSWGVTPTPTLSGFCSAYQVFETLADINVSLSFASLTKILACKSRRKTCRIFKTLFFLQELWVFVSITPRASQPQKVWVPCNHLLIYFVYLCS